MTNMNLDVIIPKECEDSIRLQVRATLDLSKLPDKVKGPIVLALRRGHTSALTGKPVWYYNALAHVYDFPVFQLGRTDRCILSFERSRSDTWVENLKADLKTMWKLALPDEQRRNQYHDHWFGAWVYPGHNEHWMQMTITRPQTLTMEAICRFMGVESLKELVPYDRRMAALLALEQGQTIDVSRFVRGVPK